ncbi:MAG: hypothetical protein HXX16_11935 [Bacteroidales bacterium]|nr:hypothetical protein [Bacteroidales bacterium]
MRNNKKNSNHESLDSNIDSFLVLTLKSTFMQINKLNANEEHELVVAGDCCCCIATCCCWS